MQTAENVIESIQQLPEKEKERLAVHILKYGILGPHQDSPEVLDLKRWQADIAVRPFNLKEASEYLGISEVTLRRWVKRGRLTACKAGRAYTFDVLALKEFKKQNLTSEDRNP
ncbi:MAG: helix-turn-helix domain-containing protein [Deltaproteobacteria bacterium]|nr:helix-turn-helix domain-containing protein [Deltaproteobacteria bacterium]MCF8120544.1 helix-turn-helix domain-containing protein [Deltaproteobacteria bacterium]